MKQNMAKILLCWKSCIFVLYIFRLFAVLMMPTSTTDEKQAKIRDMEALGRWYANALFPNEGLGGVLKPDYVAFHHNGYYASAYTPHALYNSALIQYLLSGTAFEFSKTLLCASDEWKQEPMSQSFFEPFSWKRHDVWHVNCHTNLARTNKYSSLTYLRYVLFSLKGAQTKRNIRTGLEIMRVVSVKYSSPSSVSGRFPRYNNRILAKSFPAYGAAVIGATAPNAAMDGSLGNITSLENGNLKMFLRLYDQGCTCFVYLLWNILRMLLYSVVHWDNPQLPSSIATHWTSDNLVPRGGTSGFLL